MTELTISEVARSVGIRPSAIRYYEKIKLLPQPKRIRGQRRYDSGTIHQLAVLLRARQAGFTLNEIAQLFSGFKESSPISARWSKIAERKMVELDAEIIRIQIMKELLKRLQTCCHCQTVNQCGAGILMSGFGDSQSTTNGNPLSYPHTARIKDRWHC